MGNALAAFNSFSSKDGVEHEIEVEGTVDLPPACADGIVVLQLRSETSCSTNTAHCGGGETCHLCTYIHTNVGSMQATKVTGMISQKYKSGNTSRLVPNADVACSASRNE